MLGYGGWLVLRHMLTPGDVVMFAAYLDRLYSPIDSLNGLAVSLQENLTSLRRAVKLRDSGPPEPTGAALPEGKGRVEFRDVHFGYTPDREVLHGINLTLQPGKITALAGPSGAGKDHYGGPSSQVVRAVVRRDPPGRAAAEYRPDAPRCAPRSAWWRPMGRCFAERWRRTSVTSGRRRLSEETREAALAAGLGRALERLPEGLNTEVGENGVGLSLGERQRLQIARMLVDKPRLLVLDEATANLDYATELDVRSALEQISPKPTMLVIAHRYTMMKNADYVYVLKEGEVVEEGTPAELLKGQRLVCGVGAGVGRGPQLRMKLNF